MAEEEEKAEEKTEEKPAKEKPIEREKEPVQITSGTNLFSDKEEAVPKKKKSGWFQKIPKGIFLTPGGMIILFVVLIVELLGVLIPIPIIGFIIQLPFVILLYILLMTIAKVSFKSLIIVPVIELFFPFLPTWIIRLLL